MRINCHLPITLRIVGVPTDDQLAALGRALTRAVAARLAEAERLLAHRHGVGDGGVVEVREQYDPSREGADGYATPSYEDKGAPTAVPVDPLRRSADRGAFAMGGDDGGIGPSGPFTGGDALLGIKIVTREEIEAKIRKAISHPGAKAGEGRADYRANPARAEANLYRTHFRDDTERLSYAAGVFRAYLEAGGAGDLHDLMMAYEVRVQSLTADAVVHERPTSAEQERLSDLRRQRQVDLAAWEAKRAREEAERTKRASEEADRADRAPEALSGLPGPPVSGPYGNQLADPRNPWNPNNTLSSTEMYKIWLVYWSPRYNRAVVRERAVELAVWREGAAVFAEKQDRFHQGVRTALGPEYQAAADELDLCKAVMFSLEGVLQWLEAQQAMGRRVTLTQVNEKALEITEGWRFFQMWGEPVLLGFLGAAGEFGGRSATVGPTPKLAEPQPAVPSLPEPPPARPEPATEVPTTRTTAEGPATPARTSEPATTLPPATKTTTRSGITAKAPAPPPRSLVHAKVAEIDNLVEQEGFQFEDITPDGRIAVYRNPTTGQRLNVTLRQGGPSWLNPAWGRNRIEAEMRERGFSLGGRSDTGGGRIYKNAATGETLRIMPRPFSSRRFSNDDIEKHLTGFYYRYRPDPHSSEGPHSAIVDKPVFGPDKPPDLTGKR